MENQKFNLPVLIITFNRPDLTRKILDRVVEMNPPRIYFFNDGARPGNENDAVKTVEVRAMAKDLKYEGQLFTRFEEKNLGIKMGESTAMHWLFDNEEEGIVLEDDTYPHPDFFMFCQRMLEKYRHDDRIFTITGCNQLNTWKEDIQDYHYAFYGSYWGWASWRRAWKHYDVTMPQWKEPDVRRLIGNLINHREYFKIRTLEWDNLLAGLNSSWDYQWTFAHFLNNGLSIVPSRNLITNIGTQREDAVHMTGETPFDDLQSFPFPENFRENHRMIPDMEYDQKVIHMAYPWVYEPDAPAPVPVQPTLKGKLKSILKSLVAK
jgi:hypothetical protein